MAPILSALILAVAALNSVVRADPSSCPYQTTQAQACSIDPDNSNGFVCECVARLHRRI